jgi:2-aminoethylphosphonate-pyruvate transaminase
MKTPITRKLLFNPGPATTSDTVKMAQVVPDICPREKEFGQLLNSMRNDLVRIINGNVKVYTSILFGGSGTSAMEAVLASFVPPDKSILIIVNGAYGERMCQIAETYSIPYYAVKYEFGFPINFEDVEVVLNQHDDIACISMVHHETTTGILNCIDTFAEIGKKYKKDTLLDAISSYAGIEIDLARTPIDYLLTSSNKCLQGMAGIGIVICNSNKLEKLKAYPKRLFYLDLYSQYASLEQDGQTRFTPPVQTIYALKQAIVELLEEGTASRINRYQENYKTLKEGLIEIGLKVFTQGATESGILITVHEPDLKTFNFNLLHDALYKKGFTIYPGKLSKRNTFRLAIIGDLYKADITRFIRALSSELKYFV